MAKLQYSHLAEMDLAEIAFYIAEDSPTNARNFIEKIQQKCLMLAEMPKLGREYTELASGLYGFPVKGYMIFYEISDEGIIIFRVLNAKRNIPAIFD